MSLGVRYTFDTHGVLACFFSVYGVLACSSMCNKVALMKSKLRTKDLTMISHNA